MNRIRVRQWLNAPVDLVLARLERQPAWGEGEFLELRDTILAPVLNKLTLMAWVLVENGIEDLFDEAIKRFYRIYRLPSQLRISGEVLLWQEVMLRIYVLGGLAVANGTYWPVRPLVAVSPDWDPYWRKYHWARHTLTMLARAKLLKANSLCAMTTDFLSANPYFLKHFGLGEQSKERAIDATCQFDFLQCMISAASAGETKASYPSFGAYFKTRVEPLVLDLLENGPSRVALKPMENSDVAKLVGSLDAYANKVFLMSGWSGTDWRAETIELIRRYAPDSNPFSMA